MAGRALGETAAVDRSPSMATKQSSHLPLHIRQLRRTWSLMKNCLADQSRAESFADSVRAHQREFAYVSAVSIQALRDRMNAEIAQLKKTRVNQWKDRVQEFAPAC
eukprot:3399050-Amphidinium_carterae.2